jgi:ribosomal protein S6
MKAKTSGSEKRERQVFIGFRATASEAAEIDKAAAAADLTRSAYVRSQSLKAPKMRATRRHPEEAAQVSLQFIGQIGKCGNNLNQIAHRLNSDEKVSRAMIVKSLADLREIATQITQSLGRKGLAEKAWR